MSSDQNNSDLTSKLQDLSIRNRGLNANAQAKLMAFQAKRQQQQQGQVQNKDDDLISPVLSSPSTPRNSDASGHNTPILEFPPKDESQLYGPGSGSVSGAGSGSVSASGSGSGSGGLMRRTSFRLPKKQPEGEDLLSPPINTEASNASNCRSHSNSLNQSFGSHLVPTGTTPTPDISLLPATPFVTERRPSNTPPPSSSSHTLDPNKRPQLEAASSLLPTAVTSMPELTKALRPDITKLHSSPVTPSVIQTSSPSINESGPKKPSLSQRRGMKLDISSLSGSAGSHKDPAMDKLKRNMLPQRGVPPTHGASAATGQVSNPAPVSGVGAAGLKKRPNFKLPQAQAKPSGMFANYAKYVDIKSGSLNFSGKASLHSKGVDFSNGSSFRISQDDLEFLEELGRGNYGIVSKVLHKPTGIIMAMKEVRLELDDSKFRQILMELEVLHSCVSDCIVDFYGAFFVEGAVYMCIEYMQGGSLDKIYGDGLNEAELAYVTKSVVKGLKQLKDDHNIIHRDVKPTNILVNDIGKIKLCDFGVSGNLVASLARTNIGCQSYMAPERIKSMSPDVTTYSVQSDIWSLGLSILEIAKGRYPYPPDTYDNIFSQLSAIVDGEPPTLPDDRFSAEARDFVSLCLNKNPNQRPVYGQLLSHPWLNKYDDLECQKLMSELVLDKSHEKEAASKSSGAVPPLHKAQLNN